jgi:hypothetical protein
MLVKQVNVVGSETLQGRFGDSTNRFGTTVSANNGAVFQFETKLRRNNNPLSYRLQCFAYQHFVGVGAIGLRSVEEVDAAIDGGSQYLDADTFIDSFTSAKA